MLPHLPLFLCSSYNAGLAHRNSRHRGAVERKHHMQSPGAPRANRARARQPHITDSNDIAAVANPHAYTPTTVTDTIPGHCLPAFTGTH